MRRKFVRRALLCAVPGWFTVFGLCSRKNHRRSPPSCSRTSIFPYAIGEFASASITLEDSVSKPSLSSLAKPLLAPQAETRHHA
jgi:hypothetical protein